jgi:hypothetical protein
MPFFPAPDPAGLPAPIWLLKFLSVFTLTLHLLAMNLLVGGTALLALSARRRDADPVTGRLFAYLARALPVTMSLTITIGIAPLLFVQVIYGQAFYASSVLMAWPWLTVIPLVMLAYYGLYACQFRPEWLGRHINAIAWVSGLCILAVGFLFANNWTLMLAPHAWHGLYNSGISGLHLNVGDRSLVPRFLHFIVGAFGVAGLGIIFLGRLRRREDAETADRMSAIGRRWFLTATGVEIVIGLWFLFALPAQVRSFFIGKSMLDSAALGAGILLALVALVVVRRSPGLAALATGLTVFLMVVVRHRVRQILLFPDIPVNSIEVNAQWGLLVLFVVALLAGLATVAWMVLAFARSSTPAPRPAAPAE